MIDIVYANAYTEVLEILKYVSNEEYNKISKELLDLFNENKNTNYKFNYDPSKTLQEQNVSSKAKTIIAILFRDYWATEEQRNKILEKERKDRILIEQEKFAKYDINNIFKNNKNDTFQNSSNLPIEQVNIFTKIIKFIKRTIKKNSK